MIWPCFLHPLPKSRLDPQNCRLKKVSCFMMSYSASSFYLPSFPLLTMFSLCLALPAVLLGVPLVCREITLGAGPGTVWGFVGSNPAAGCVHLLCKEAGLCTQPKANIHSHIHKWSIIWKHVCMGHYLCKYYLNSAVLVTKGVRLSTCLIDSGLVWRRRGDNHSLCWAFRHPPHPHCQCYCRSMAGKQCVCVCVFLKHVLVLFFQYLNIPLRFLMFCYSSSRRLGGVASRGHSVKWKCFYDTCAAKKNQTRETCCI